MKQITHIVPILLTLLLGAIHLCGQSTAFTYQGRLNSSGSPANGVYDFTFQAFDAITNGASIGGTVNVNAVGVTNGLFTALVDLGSSPFTGPARWLQISVSTNGAGSFTTLTPRQPLTPSPYAIYARTAGTVPNGAIANAQLAANSVATGNIQANAITADRIAPGQAVKSLNGLTDAVSLTQGANITINTVGNSLSISAPAGGLNLPFSGSASNSGSIFTLTNSGIGPVGVFLGRVGIGTTTPNAPLHIASDDFSVITLQDTGANLTQSGYISFRNGTLTETAWVGFGTPGDPDFSIVNARSGGDIILSPFSGNVGIGTPTPTSKLEVHGDIRLGPSGQFRAVSGEENLRIIRGTLNGNGTIAHGTGFTVSHTAGSGLYTINFTTPFANTPTVTATAFDPGSNLFFATINTVSSSSALIVTWDDSSTETDDPFHFIAIGPR